MVAVIVTFTSCLFSLYGLDSAFICGAFHLHPNTLSQTSFLWVLFRNVTVINTDRTRRVMVAVYDISAVVPDYMPLNISGLLAPFQLLWNPRVVLPHVIVTGQTHVCWWSLY